MSSRIDYTNQVIGTRKIIKNYCDEEDWINSGLKQPKNKTEYRLGQCLNCGTIMPVNIKVLKRNPPQRCSYCSNMGHRSTNKAHTNNWTEYKDYAVLNVLYKDKIVSVYIDAEDYEKCKERQWRISQKRNKYYVITGSGTEQIYLHHFLIGKPEDMENFEVHHKDGNSLNNRKDNLCFIEKSLNKLLVKQRIDNQIGIRGVSFSKKESRYIVDFIYMKKRYYFKHWESLEEAVWCRYCCEKYFNMNFMIESNPLFEQYNTLSDEKKEDINNYVIQKIESNLR